MTRMDNATIKAVVADLAPVIREFTAAAVAPLIARIDGIDQRLAGFTEAASLDEVRAEVTAVRAAVAAIPTAPELPDIPAMIAEAVAAIDLDALRGEPGKPVDPAEVEAMVARAVDALPAPEPGRPGIGLADALIDRDGTLVVTLSDGSTRNLGSVVGASVDEKAVAAMVDKAVAALPEPEPGKSVTVADVEPILTALVEAAVAALPAPEKGKDADPVVTASLVRDEVAKATAGIPASITAAVYEAVAQIPKPENGKDVKPETIREMVAEAVAALPAPEPGKGVTIDQVAPVIAAEVEKAVSSIPKPRDGVGLAGAIIDREGGLVVTLSDGSTRELGRVEGRDATPIDMDEVEELIGAKVSALPKPKDGLDGLGFDDLTVEYDGERRFCVKFVKGERIKEFAIDVPVMLFRGPYELGRGYEPGDVVQQGGHLWHCGEATADKPGDSKAWKLAVRRGKDAAPEPVKIDR